MIPSELIGENLQLLSLPAVVVKINELLDAPDTSVADVAQFIGQDPALTAQLLKIVNSPFYNFPSQIDSISMAITILGTKQLRDLVITTTLVDNFHPEKDVGFNLEAFWCHSITTGLAARLIATSHKTLNADRLFICGLLHDIGKMAMGLLLPEQAIKLQNLNKKIALTRKDNEKEVFKFTHGDWAMALLESWKFPASIIEPVVHHHIPEQSIDYTIDTYVLHAANVIANNIQEPVSADDDTILHESTLSMLAISQSEFEAYYEQVYDLLDDVLQMFYYDIAA